MLQSLKFLACAMLLSTAPLPAQTPDTACILVFCDSNAQACDYIKEGVLPPLADKYAARLQVSWYNVQDPAAARLRQGLETAYDDRNTFFPAVFIGGRFFCGRNNIKQKLPPRLEYVLSSGGCGWPSTNPEPSTPRAAVKPGTARILFFFAPDCGYCKDVRADFMPRLIKEFGSMLEVRYVDLDTPAGGRLAGALEDAYHESGNYTPMVFANGRFFSGAQEVTRKLEWWVGEIIRRGGCAFPAGPGKDGN